MSDDPKALSQAGPQNPNERAFVVRFEPMQSVRGLFRGRVELVASGEALRFRSLKQLLGFMTAALRRHVRPVTPRLSRPQPYKQGGTTTTSPFATTPFKVKARIKP